jgi:putative hydrolase of the HAD superfamily
MDKQALTKAVIFDLGNVILAFRNRPISAFIASKSGHNPDEIHSFVFGTELERSLDMGKISLAVFLERINRRFSSGISLEEFTPVWCDMFTQNAGIEEIIRGLKRNGCRLGILSNTNKPHFEFVKGKFPVLGLFDLYHLSYETGCLKPERCAFDGLKECYKDMPGPLVFIDDLPMNVEAARLAGLNAFRYTSPEALRADLEGAGLKL